MRPHRSVRLVPAILSVLVVAAGTLFGTAGTAAAAPAPASSVHLVASRQVVTDSTGRAWQPDAGYVQGGSLSTSKATVRGTASPQLYRAQRSGGASYSIPVSATGTYGVVLYLAELGGKTAGQRVFDVRSEGVVASTVDVAAAAGRNAAWHVMFEAPVADGELNLSLVARTGQAMVSAVAVDFMRPELTSTQVFGDEFNDPQGSPPSVDRWTQDVFPGNNNQLQHWADHNATTDGAGSMAITARHETFTGPTGVTRDYTSARLTTAGHFTWFYGTAEARILTPAGQGLWPAFWSVGQQGGWPSNGEIDGMEMKGQDSSWDQGAVHGVNRSYSEWTYHLATTSKTPLAGSWHTYGMQWLPGVVATTLDGRPFMTVTPADLPAADIWPFDAQAFVLRLQMAVGGDFVGAPSGSTVFPATMNVDWVRVTQ